MPSAPAQKRLRIGALASGNGSNLQAIIDACEAAKIDAEVVLVISNKADAHALQRAQNHGIKASAILPAAFGSREDYDREVVAQLHAEGVDLVVLAGYMRLISDGFLEAYPQRIMNIHPSLLPSFPGLHVHQQAIDYGVRFSGCTVHFVDSGLDTGPIILQAVVPVEADDTAETLAARILVKEHEIYPQAIQLFASDALQVQGRRVVITETELNPATCEE